MSYDAQARAIGYLFAVLIPAVIIVAAWLGAGADCYNPTLDQAIPCPTQELTP